MYRLFCCRTRNPNRVEVDQVTDSLETCLTIDKGVGEFKSFLKRNNFNEDSTTLAFALKCQSILADISRLSPITRTTRLPARIKNDIDILYDMANNINFDLDQMNALQNLHSTDIENRYDRVVWNRIEKSGMKPYRSIMSESIHRVIEKKNALNNWTDHDP